ncbi:invasion associated locus B family protein [Bombella pollinis]|uniref:Invasion associated locus B family protein n=1 Tax=Bombella pollinis TaxID=2967337 RepID=A0ABT3WKQ2_9PROT|nr:invasion associated locus B family protein [Bombella pollinis]MCX5619626.1 invasion associated locus B family protein [Bombella pollinis]
MFLRQTTDMKARPIAQQPWGVSVVFPASVAVDQSVPAQLVIEQGPTLSINWRSCTDLGCSVRIPAIPEAVIQALKTKKQAHFTAKQKNGTVYSYDFSLDVVNTGLTQVDSWIEHGELIP